MGVLATPLEPDFEEELPNIKSVPSSQDDEISKEIQKLNSTYLPATEKKPESITEYQENNSSNSLIKPPLPVFKNISNNSASGGSKQNVLANVFSSRGARLLMASKQQKISSSPGSQSNSSQDSPTTSSYSQLSLMSPRPDLKSLNNDIMTPTQPKGRHGKNLYPPHAMLP